MIKQCEQCNSPLTAQSKFCTNCGATVRDAASPEAAYTQPQDSQMPPVQQAGYTPPTTSQGVYTPPAQNSYTPPQQQTYTPPAQQQGGYVPPPQGYAPPQESYSAQNAYSAPQKQKKPINPKIFIFGGAALALVLIVVLLVSLLGGKDKDSKDPNIGVWKAISVEMFDEEFDAVEIFDGEVALELMAGGKCEWRFGGEKDSYKWAIEKNTVTIKSGSDVLFTGTIKNDMLVVDDFSGTGMKVTFKKEGSESSKPSQSGKTPQSSTAPEDEAPDTDVQAKWSGTWYGDLWVTDASGDYTEYEDNMFNAYMVLDIEKNGDGTMAIFLGDDEGKTVDAYIHADIHHFEVTEGDFWDMPLDPSAWWLALSPVDEGNLIVISDTYIDPERTPNDGFEFMFRFRPFGELWEKEEREGKRLPPGYANYVKAIESGVTDPNAWSDDDDYGYTDSDDLALDPDEDALAPKAEVTPHFTSAQLKSIKEKLSKAYDNSSLGGMLYEEVRDAYFEGVDGEIYLETENISQYYWYAVNTNKDEYVAVTFQNYGDGKKTAGGISSYLP